MNSSSSTQEPGPLTLELVYRELRALRERVEDLEDLHDLEKAIAENGDEPLIPWEEAKKSLDLE